MRISLKTISNCIQCGLVLTRRERFTRSLRVFVCVCLPRDRHLERDFLFFEMKQRREEEVEEKNVHKTRIRELMQRVISEESI